MTRYTWRGFLRSVARQRTDAGRQAARLLTIPGNRPCDMVRWLTARQASGTRDADYVAVMTDAVTSLSGMWRDVGFVHGDPCLASSGWVDVGQGAHWRQPVEAI